MPRKYENSTYFLGFKITACLRLKSIYLSIPLGEFFAALPVISGHFQVILHLFSSTFWTQHQHGPMLRQLPFEYDPSQDQRFLKMPKNSEVLSQRGCQMEYAKKCATIFAVKFGKSLWSANLSWGIPLLKRFQLDLCASHNFYSET